MEWIATKCNDGKEYYKVEGYKNGHCGDKEYIIETIEIPLIKEKFLNESLRISNEKYNSYLNYKNPSNKILKRIERNKEKIDNLNGIIQAINKLKGE